nr:alanine racemase [Lachnospiraceae bacterium]
QVVAVIKTDGYGHGAVEIARDVEELPYLWGFAVAAVEEGMELRRAGIRKPILILGYTFPSSYPYIVKEELRPAVFRLDQAEELSREAVKQGKDVFFHLAVDTGMRRIGVYPKAESLPLVKQIFSLPNVIPEGIFTHFARADEEDRSPADIQFQAFQDFITLCEKEGVNFRLHHASNSAGIAVFPEANLDLVRGGITLYGLKPSSDLPEEKLPYRHVLELKSHIVYIKYIDSGDAVSYGGTYVAKERRRIATIPVGYGDGYPRLLSGKGSVLIRGKRAPILGRVCMDQFMVDVTDIPDAREGDLVTLIGIDGDDRITMEEIGDISGRFNYELACDLGRRIPRIFIKDGKVISKREFIKWE